MRLLALCALIGCGDNVTLPGFDSSFDIDTVRYFGSVKQMTPPLPVETPRPGSIVCLAEECIFSDESAEFVIVGPPAPAEVLITVRATDTVPVVLPSFSGPTVDRNMSTVTVFAQQVVDDTAAVFGEAPGLDVGGIVRVIVDRHDDAELQIELDGRAGRYFDDDRLPDPSLTMLTARGRDVMFYGVPAGEATVRATNGTCTVDLDGWQRGPNEVRVPVLAGHITRVRPICIGPTP